MTASRDSASACSRDVRDGVQPGVRDAVRASIDRLAALGAKVDDVALPHADHALSAYYLIAPAEASSNLARFDGVRLRASAPTPHADSNAMKSGHPGSGFGDEVKRRIMLGTYALSAGYYDAYYGQAQKVRTLVIRDYEEGVRRFDVLVSPTSPTGLPDSGSALTDPLAMYLSDVFTIPADLAGSRHQRAVRAGLGGLPVGLQFTAPALGEPVLFRAARALERELGLDPAPHPRGRLSRARPRAPRLRPSRSGPRPPGSRRRRRSCGHRSIRRGSANRGRRPLRP